MILGKRILVPIIVAAICLFSAATSAADNWQWYECTVIEFGVGGGRYEFMLSGNNTSGGTPSAINSWFEIHPSSENLKKEILAVVLTAVSLGKKVRVLLIPEVTKSIYALYLEN